MQQDAASHTSASLPGTTGRETRIEVRNRRISIAGSLSSWSKWNATRIIDHRYDML